MKIEPKPAGIKPPGRPKEDADLKAVSRQFESLLVNQMVSAMRKTVIRQGLIPESNAEKIYQSMLDQQYSERIAEGEGMGLSKLVYERLLRVRSSR